MKSYKKYLICFFPIVVYFIIQMVSATGYFLLKSNRIDLMMIESSTISDREIRVLSIITNIVAIIVFALWYRKLKRDTIKLKKIFYVKHIIILCILGVCIQVGTFFLLNTMLFMRKEWFYVYKEHMEGIDRDKNILSKIHTIIITPIIEELMFRGVIFEKCKKVMPYIIANIVQALIFGIYHQNIIQGFFTFLVGICLGIICIKLQSLFSVILVHIVINGSSFLLNIAISNVNGISIDTMVILATIGVMGIIFCLMYIKKIINNSSLNL